MNWQITVIALCTISATILSGCSCAIFKEDYSLRHPATNVNSLRAKETIERIGFKEKQLEKENTSYFKKRDLKLFYDESEQTISLHSSYCPFIIFRMNPSPWMDRCELYTEELKAELLNAGFQINKIPPLHPQPTHSTESNQSE